MDENRLEQLIVQLKTYPIDEELLSNCSAEEKEILLLTAELKSIPVLNPPKAVARRKYALEKIYQPSFKTVLFSFKFAGMFAILIFVFVASLSAYNISQSLPGQKLFSIKKTAEQLRVKFAAGDIRVAYLQVQIAKKRVAEAEQLALAENRNPQAELAALKEVSQATELAASKVETLSPKTIRDSEKQLLDSLEAVSRQEQHLVSNLSANNNKDKNDNRDKEDVIALSLKNQTKVSAIKQAVIAASAEETIANLSPDLNEVLISGQVTQNKKNSITIEKTVFEIDEKTVFVSQTGENLDQNTLKIGVKVAAVGKKTSTSGKATADRENKLFAVKLTVFSDNKETIEIPETIGEVKGENTVPNKPNSTTPASILPPKPDTENLEPVLANPNSATGGVIFEDPLPKFAP